MIGKIQPAVSFKQFKYIDKNVPVAIRSLAENEGYRETLYKGCQIIDGFLKQLGHSDRDVTLDFQPRTDVRGVVDAHNIGYSIGEPISLDGSDLSKLKRVFEKTVRWVTDFLDESEQNKFLQQFWEEMKKPLQTRISNDPDKFVKQLERDFNIPA